MEFSLRRYRPGFFTGFEESDDVVPEWDGDASSVRWLREMTERSTHIALVIAPYGYRPVGSSTIVMDKFYDQLGAPMQLVIGFIDAPFDQVLGAVRGFELEEMP